jgi:hypothetical protein
MAILDNQELTRRLAKLETETKIEIEAHRAKINSLEIDTISSLRNQVQALAARVHHLEKLLKAAGILKDL